MSYYVSVAYVGSTPGADSNTYVLVNTTSIAGTGPLQPTNYKRYLLSLNNAAAGTLNVYASTNAGVAWKSIYTVAVSAATSNRNNEFAIPTFPHVDIKVEWVNGGSAQTTWVVTQAFDDGISEFRPQVKDAAGDADGGVSTTVDSAQLPSSLGQKAMAASLAVVVASNQSTLPVSNTQLPSALGAQTAATSLSVIQATALVTDNTTYIASGDMSASIDGPSITVGKEGTLRAEISWANTGTPVGTISLQHLMLDGSTWIDVPGASAEFTTQPNNNTVTLSCYWTGLQAFTTVRIKYTRASGGTANTSFNVDTRVR